MSCAMAVVLIVVTKETGLQDPGIVDSVYIIAVLHLFWFMFNSVCFYQNFNNVNIDIKQA